MTTSEGVMTPGQAAYEARLTARRTRLLCAGESAGTERPWPHLTAAERADEEAAAQAAIAIAASHSAIYLTAIATLSAALHDIRDCTGTSTEAHHIARKALDDVDHIRPAAASASQRRRLDAQAAPELAAAMAETRKVADAANVVFDLFGRSSDGWHARISGVNLMRAYKAIGRPVPGHLSHLEGQ